MNAADESYKIACEVLVEKIHLLRIGLRNALLDERLTADGERCLNWVLSMMDDLQLGAQFDGRDASDV